MYNILDKIMTLIMLYKWVFHKFALTHWHVI